ncbi:XRE family transcriptional regulator [Rhodobacter sp. 140A]|nr:XRE family transcriptional regulator [Rhodobacter sp. 140A]
MTSDIDPAEPQGDTAAPPSRRAAEPSEADSIGMRLRAERLKQGMTLGRLSEEAGLSIGALSQVERGLVSPTVRTIYAIAGVLGISPASVIDPVGAQAAAPEDSPFIVRRTAQPKVLDTNGVTKLLATPIGHSRYKGYVVTIAPGGSSGENSYAHEGEEVGVVTAGSFSLQIEGRIHLLGPGDSFTFPSTLRHRFFNDGDVPAEVIWVNSTS